MSFNAAFAIGSSSHFVVALCRRRACKQGLYQVHIASGFLDHRRGSVSRTPSYEPWKCVSKGIDHVRGADGKADLNVALLGGFGEIPQADEGRSNEDGCRKMMVASNV
jgi:hypothetical protein